MTTSGNDPAARAREIGQQLGRKPGMVNEVLPELAALLAEHVGIDGDEEVLEATIDALGQTWDERGAALLLPLADGRPLPLDVRFSLVCALPHAIESETLRSAVIAALLPMTTDPDDDVRDWACFGLGQLDADTPAARDALAARLDDEHDETRGEALVALGKTGDPRAMAAVTVRLQGDPATLSSLEIQAAAELADPVLLPVLTRLEAAWEEDDDELAEELAFAVKRCAVGNALQAVDVEARLVDELQALVDPRIVVTVEGVWPRTTVRLEAPGVGSARPDRVWDEVARPDELDVRERALSYAATALTQFPALNG